MVLVCDAAALTELARRSLLTALPSFPFALTVVDALFEDRRFELPGLSWRTLRRLGLRVGTLNAQGVALAMTCQRDWPMLSSHDCFTVALAWQRRRPLLTQHGCVAAAALGLAVRVRDLH